MATSQVIGIGTDIVECERIASMIEKHGDLFLNRVFTPEEIRYCSQGKASVQHFAGRWAAKEAILKALGTGWARGIRWTDIEVINDGGGKPSVRLHQIALSTARGLGVTTVMISISHTRGHAIAFATALGATENAGNQE